MTIEGAGLSPLIANFGTCGNDGGNDGGIVGINFRRSDICPDCDCACGESY